MTVTFKAEPNKYLHILIYILSIPAARPLLVNFPNETYFKLKKQKTAYLIHVTYTKSSGNYKLPRSNCKIFPSPRRHLSLFRLHIFWIPFSFYEGLTNNEK